MDTNDDEFSFVGFHEYMANAIPFLQVRSVLFQPTIFHMREALKASSEQKIQNIVCYVTLLPAALVAVPARAGHAASISWRAPPGISRWYPAGKAGNLMGACHLLLCSG